MATPKKKHLIQLMIEAGVEWPVGAEYSAQDNEVMHKVCFYKTKPVKYAGMNSWSFRGYVKHSAVPLPSLCRNWNQTIVTREQYMEALADVTQDAHQEELESNSYPAVADTGCFDCDNPPTIEQLTADYRAKASEADRLQVAATEALKAADDALLALEKAGELIGLIISIDTNPKQPVITDWRDLRVGDVIFIGESSAPFTAPSGEYHVVGLDAENETQPASVEWGGGEVWPLLAERGWRFIRRP